MSATVLVDLAVVVLLVLAAWSGGRTGAARSAISLIALALGLIISAQGQSAITAFIAQIFPDVDTRLIGLGIFIGGIWILLTVASYLIGRLLQASLRAIRGAKFRSECARWGKGTNFDEDLKQRRPLKAR